MSTFTLLGSKILKPIWSDSFSRFIPTGLREISHSSALGFNTTDCLMAMPVKRKRRLDPQVVKLREERKRRKIEKEIRKLQKLSKTLKPIEEARMPASLYKDIERRSRNIKLTKDVEEERIQIHKRWSKISWMHNQMVAKDVTQIILSQQQALDELYKESVELYNAAIQIDPDFLPFSFNGPSETPPIEDYNIPDGDYIDISKKWLND